MSSQNINSYYYPRYKMKLNYGQYFDLTLASDERDYDEEVVFSDDVIAVNDGNRLPISFDLSNSGSTKQYTIDFGDYYDDNTLVSLNYYNPKNLDYSCYTAYTGICDVGLVATDNGLFNQMTGETLYYIKGIDNTYKFEPDYRDSRFKMHPVRSFAKSPNVKFSGRSKNTLYNIVSKTGDTVGYYQELYGGFYQGFYKLFGHDYEVFPERVNKGWSVEMLLKPRITEEYNPNYATEQYLNDVYPSNAGTFFYFGTRAENKYYHLAEGSTEFSGLSNSSGSTWIFDITESIPSIGAPASTKFSVNNLTASSITQININKIANDSNDYSSLFLNVKNRFNSGDTVYLQIKKVSTNTVIGVWQLNSTPTINVNYTIFPVTNIFGSGLLLNLNEYELSWQADSSGTTSTLNYGRITNDLTCIESCACSDTGVTNANCIHVYPNSGFTTVHNTGCNCGCASTEIVPLPETDPKFDVLSNALSFQFSGCPLNPSLAVKYIKITGDCVTTGTCETTGVTFQTGYTITTVVTPPIYEICNLACDDTDEERWVMISSVFERYKTIEECDLLNLGGLNDLRLETYQSSIDGQSYKLISPPNTHPGDTKEPKVYKVRFDRKWFEELDYRLGTLKLYVNGYLFLVIEDFEEIIPRELNTEKEKQVGVPFNISFGGGTQGLHDHLIFSGCSNPYGPYIQDPELFPNNILSATTLSGLSTNILLEQNFGGTFMGGISQFRMYVEPLSSPQVQHNFRILKNKFNLFDFWCPNCTVTNGYMEEGYADFFYFE